MAMVVVVKEKILNYCMNLVKNKYPNYDEDKLEVIAYGLEGLYLTFTKIIIIIGLSLILGKLKNVLMLILFYNLIRFFSFGLHAKKSYQCLIMSISLFIGGMYLCEYISINFYIKVMLGIICIILMAKYAPADTEKRPLINKKQRYFFKLLSLFQTTIFTIFIVIFDDRTISNYLLVGLIEATLMILPISYKILKLPYDNYKRYNLTKV